MAAMFNSMTDGAQESAVLRVLRRLDYNRTPVRLEVENSNVSFYTLISLKADSVLLNRPADLSRKLLKKGRGVRFEVPDGSRNALRMEVRNPALKRKRGDVVVVCGVPRAFAPRTRRTAERFNTSRFSNLYLSIPQADVKFRVIDISLSGCKVFAEGFDEWELIRVGYEMRFTKILVGDKVEVPLQGLIPRLIKSPTIGFEWKVQKGSRPANYLDHFVTSLNKLELGRMQIKESEDGAV